MFKRINFFLVFIVFFNFVFGFNNKAYSELSFGSPEFESRVRKFDQIRFTYSEYEGFTCETDGMKGYYFVSEEDKNSASNTTEAGMQTLMFVNKIINALIFPLKCFLSVAVMLKTASFAGGKIASKFMPKKDDAMDNAGSGGAGILVFALIIVSILGEVSNSLIASIVRDDDYLVDASNTHITCQALVVFNTALCLAAAAGGSVAYGLIKSGQYLLAGGGIASLFAMTLALNEIVDALTVIPLKNAQAAFYRLALCGDEWLTYGHSDLEKKIKEIKDYNPNARYLLTGAMTSEINADIFLGRRYGSGNTMPTETIGKNSGGEAEKLAVMPFEHYPIRGAFPGSYKFLLDKCFSDREWLSCKKLFLGALVVNENTDLNELYNIKYRQYREYVYGGMEYEYSFCTDPRPERAIYQEASGSSSQTYYFRGNDSPNFACDRFVIDASKEYAEAFKCCQEVSQTKICVRQKANSGLRQGEKHAFCNIYNDYDDNKCEFNFDEVSSNEIQQGEIEKLCDGLIGSTVTDEEKKKEAKENCIEVSSKAEGGIKSVQLQVKESKFSSHRYCVETRNLCPFNFALGGGSERYGNEFVSYSEEVKIDKDRGGDITNQVVDTGNEEVNIKDHCVFEEMESGKTATKYCPGVCFDPGNNKENSDGEYLECYGRPSNFCQVDRNCVTLAPFIENEAIPQNPYLDKACMNFKGSSNNFRDYKNLTTYMTGQSASGKNLFAPFVECFVETFKNMLLNQAGHTRCYDVSEIPAGDTNESCASGARYVKGSELIEEEFPSPFLKMKRNLEITTRILVALSVILYGFYLLLGKSNGGGNMASLDPKELFDRIIKMVFVLYISTSTAWVRPMFKFIFGAYGAIVNYSMEIMINDPNNNGGSNSFYDNPEFPGCYFFKNDFMNNNYSNYEDRGYLALFDTLDCKLSLYMGSFTDEVTDPPILGFIIASIFTFGLVIPLVFPFVVLFLSLIYICMKIAYSFIVVSFKCVFLLFVLPVIMPFMLFDDTKGIFDSWLKTVVKNLLSPMFIIVGAGLFFMLFDKYYVGDVKFIGDRAPIRNFYCGKICKHGGGFYYITGGNESEEKTIIQRCESEDFGKVINLKSTSLMCALKSSSSAPGKTGSSVLDFFVQNAYRGTQLIVTATHFFDMFIEVMFLLILIFLFDQFSSKFDGINNAIFGGGNEGNVKDLPTFKDFVGKAANLGAKLSNIGLNNPKALVGKGISKIKSAYSDHKMNKYEREGGEKKKKDEGGKGNPKSKDGQSDEGGSESGNSNSDESGSESGNSNDDENK
jgi:hypothetical protein